MTRSIELRSPDSEVSSPSVQLPSSFLFQTEIISTYKKQNDDYNENRNNVLFDRKIAVENQLDFAALDQPFSTVYSTIKYIYRL